MQVAPPPKPHELPPPIVSSKPVVAPAPVPVSKPIAPTPAVVTPTPTPAVVPPPPTKQEEIIEEEESEEEEPEEEVSEEEDTADEGAQEKKYEKAESAKQKAEQEKYESEKAEVEADAMGVDDEELLPSMTCPRCHNTFKGDWEHCPFCDLNLKTAAKAEAPVAEPPKTESVPATSGISILGYTPKKTAPEPAPAVVPSSPEPKKIPVVSMDQRFTEPPRPAEAKPAPPSIVPPLPDFQRTMTSAPPPPPPVVATPPPVPVAPSAAASKDKCPSCGKAVKPHWRNCPYCKATLK
jgi:hypothetical protein